MKRFLSIIFALGVATTLFPATELLWNSNPQSPLQYRLSDNTFSSTIKMGQHSSTQINTILFPKQHSFGNSSYTMPHAQLSQVGATQPNSTATIQQLQLKPRQVSLPSEPYRTPINDEIIYLSLLAIVLLIYRFINL